MSITKPNYNRWNTRGKPLRYYVGLSHEDTLPWTQSLNEAYRNRIDPTYRDPKHDDPAGYTPVTYETKKERDKKREELENLALDLFNIGTFLVPQAAFMGKAFARTGQYVGRRYNQSRNFSRSRYNNKPYSYGTRPASRNYGKNTSNRYRRR